MSKKLLLLITGEPGVGKTTLVKKIFNRLKERVDVAVGGFFTEEVRSDETGSRLGFDLVSFDDSLNRLPLARKNGQTNCHVGPYSVFVENIESFTLPILEVSWAGD